MPSQISGCGPVPPWQTRAPFTQAVRPGEHGGWLMPQGRFTPKTLSSTTPSQSLSMPSQTSVEGPTKPTQTFEPHAFVPILHWLFGP